MSYLIVAPPSGLIVCLLCMATKVATLMSVLDKVLETPGKSRSILIMILGIGLISFALVTPSKDADRDFKLIVLALGAVMTLLGLGIELMSYLQSARQTFAGQKSFDDQIFQYIDPINSQLLAITSTVDSIKKSKNSNITFTEAERMNLLNSARENLTSNIVSQISSQWEAKYNSASVIKDTNQFIESIAQDTRRRLQQEVFTLGRRANLNLVIGALVSILGIGLLWYFIFVTTADISNGVQLVDISLRFAIRFSLVVVIQLFAYFFLRLYRYSIFETKYFQNEITNVDLKLIALRQASLSEDKKLIGAMCTELAKTERNFILKKGETTVSLRRDEMEIQYENDMLSKFERFASARGGKEKRQTTAETK